MGEFTKYLSRYIGREWRRSGGEREGGALITDKREIRISRMPCSPTVLYLGRGIRLCAARLILRLCDGDLIGGW